MNIIRWFFSLLGFVPKSEIDQAEKYIASLKHMNNKMQKECGELNVNYNALAARLKELDADTIEQIRKENKTLKLHIDKIQSDIKNAEEYYNQVQRQLSEAMHDDPIFGFATSKAIPGASVVTNVSIPGNNVAVVGRTIFDDNVTAKINAVPDVNDKYQIVINNLIKLGLIDQIAKNMLTSGAVQFTLAFNGNCTTSEVYYEVHANRPESIFEIKLDEK